MTIISTALPSGRLLKDSKDFLKKIGINVKEPANRELISYENGYTFYFPRAFDVPVYVENGVDIGICGSDVALERSNEVYIPLELPFGKCRMSI
ncbi:MAG TPA: ATP phosphoribosyltransferase, partial [Petrotoga sp.]|nr:ATP phosphoribosyltransferase [Petrotoga sp.]